MAEALAVVTDLIFSTKILATARDLGVEAQAVTTPDALIKALDDGGVRLVIVDMSLPPELAVSSLQCAATHHTVPTTLAFYSHVNTELLDRAEAAGATLTMPRSKFSAELPEILKRLCPPPPPRE